ncbi:MAG: hypothetical protein M1423_09230 [Acidobacteria bacterium]|nr:hypothetical protein [Acidobacteriota bacterium]
MRISSKLRVLALALALFAIPASSWAGVFISVGFAPPVLPVYVQPPCPHPGWMWTPGYWGYGADGYYWVPGTWVPAPYMGALWTPPYWGWSSGLYVFHPGYWGPHVGYYGGVNYGFGYMGVGFVGGMWHGGAFAYNTAVMNVNRTVIHNTYIDRTVVRNNTIINNNRVAYSGGPGGINHPPTAQENAFSHEQHMAATQMQTQHETAAMHNVNSYASRNGGHPQNLAMARPMGGNGREALNNNAPRANNQGYRGNRMGQTNQQYRQRQDQAARSWNRGGQNGHMQQKQPGTEFRNRGGQQRKHPQAQGQRDWRGNQGREYGRR